MDEVPVNRDRWSSAPRYVSFALTNACELSCAFCYAPKQPAKLIREEVLDWSRELDAAGCFGIGFGGGEPTLLPGFADLCRDLHAQTELAITMTTHAHRFDPELSEKLKGNVDFIRVSMDGIDEVYERIRGRSFDDFRKKLSLVKETSRFGINYVVNAQTIDHLPLAADFANASGAEEFLLLPETGSNGEVRVDQSILTRLSSWANENYDRCRLAASAHGIRHLDAPALISSNPEFESYDFMHIDAFGKLKTCAFTSEGKHIRDYPSLMECIDDTRLN